MKVRRMISFITLAVMLFAGAWLLTSSRGVGIDAVERQNALGALAPAGFQHAEGVSAPIVEGKTYPVSVNLANVPVGEYDPDNQYDRWLRGEIDLDERDGIVSEEQKARLIEESLMAKFDSDIQVGVPGLGAPTPAGVAFNSIDYNGCCGGGGNVPPDPEMAAGPNHLIAVVNVSLEVYDKTGTSLTGGPVTLASFMSANALCTGLFDPNALYDEKADRFMVGADANGTHYCAAVTQTSNPLGAWNIYAFPTQSGSEFYDYPHAGIGEDAIYVGSNIFNPGFQEGRIHAFDKAAMYTGAGAASLVQNLGGTHDTPQPMNLHGFAQGTWPGTLKHYILVETNYNGANHTLFEWDGPFSGPNTFGSVAAINLNTATGVVAGIPVNVPQNGAGLLQANDWRPLDFEYRNGYAWTTMTIGCNPGGGTVDCVRWAQINVDPSNGALGAIGPEGAGVYSTQGDYRTFPDLAVDHDNCMAVGYTKSNTSIWPAIWVNGRTTADPPGTLQTEVQLKAGEIVYTAFDGSPHRWGDYTGMTVDPDGQTFWYLGEYSKITGNPSGRWGTYIGNFDYDCGEGPIIMQSVRIQGRARNGRAQARVWVEDLGGLPVPGATVTIKWRLPSGAVITQMSITGANGAANFSSPPAGSGAYKLRITNITKTGYLWNGGLVIKKQINVP